MPLATGVMLVGCFNPPELEDSTAGSSTGPGPTTGVDGSSSGMSPETTVSSLDGSTGSPETTSGPGTTDGGSSESTAAGPQPDIEVSIDGMVIPSGGTYPIADTVDVGALGAVVTVTIENVGDDTLTLSGLTPGGPDVSHFAVDIMGVSPSLGVGESTSFGLRFAPINGGRKGLLVSVGSDDPDEDPYEITFDAHTTPNRYRPLAMANPPSARFNMAMAAIPGDRILMFGGRDNSNTRLNDTWVFDVEAGTWSQIIPGPSPPIRDAHEMVYIGNDTVVLYGGNTVNGGDAVGLADTWIFDIVGENWSQVMTPGPGPRFQHMMVSLGTEALLFGGRTGFTHLNDTWRFDGATQTWSNLMPAGSTPTGRITSAMAYDGVDIVALYGGFNNNNPLGDTYEYTVSTNSWTLSPPGISPGIRGTLEGVFLEAGRMIVYSGKADSCCDDPDPGTFAYDPTPSTWVDITPPLEPTPRYNYGMAAVPLRNKAIIFGGQLLNAGAGSSVTDTIEYVGPRP